MSVRTTALTQRITRRRLGVRGEVSISHTTATADFVRIGAFVPQTLASYFPAPLPASDPDADLYGILRAIQNVTGEYSDGLVDAVMSHQVAHADRQGLNKIGSLFGAVGARRGRDNDTYREFLRGIQQSFRGRGTVPGIKFAVSAGIRSDPTNITVDEDYADIGYSLTIDDWRSHRVTSIEQLADLADASGAEHQTPVTYLPEGSAVTTEFGPTAYERLFDLDGFGMTAELGPTATESVSSGLGSGQIGDGTRLGPEESA